MSDPVGLNLINQSFKFQKDLNLSLWDSVHQKHKNMNNDDAAQVFLGRFGFGKQISVREIVVLKETLASQLPEFGPVEFVLWNCKFEDDLALECFQAYLLELQSKHHPITKLMLGGTQKGSGTQVSYRFLASLLYSLGTKHLTTLTISLLTDNADGNNVNDNNNNAHSNTGNEENEGLQLRECLRHCKALERLILAANCKFLDKERLQRVLSGLHGNDDDNNSSSSSTNQSPSFLPNLETLGLEKFHTNDSGIEAMANGLMGLATALHSLRLVELSLYRHRDDNNSLKPPSLVHLTRLFSQLPAHVSASLCLLNYPELFSGATPDQVEQFSRALECRPCWGTFSLSNVGLKGPQAKHIFKALETMELSVGSDENRFVNIDGSRILEDKDAWEQLMESLPKMKHVAVLMVGNDEPAAQDWPAAKDEQLLNALEQNAQLCYMECNISNQDRLHDNNNLAVKKRYEAIVQRNKTFHDLPKVWGTFSHDTPPGWAADVLEQFAFGRGGELGGADMAYHILCHEAGNIWKCEE